MAADFTVISGHLDPGRPPEDGMDWDYLATGPSTLVLLMAMDRLDKIARELILRGRDPGSPAAAIANATLPDQIAVRAPLSELAERVTEAGLAAPAVIVIGAVVDALSAS
jgi:uroporphyrin-III C-methyltransferase/precorrin-2 dehydrogenase/sirohydrochlorin ferrochelatase